MPRFRVWSAFQTAKTAVPPAELVAVTASVDVFLVNVAVCTVTISPAALTVIDAVAHVLPTLPSDATYWKLSDP